MKGMTISRMKVSSRAATGQSSASAQPRIGFRNNGPANETTRRYHSISAAAGIDHTTRRRARS